jgi:hypothetical protein
MSHSKITFSESMSRSDLVKAIQSLEQGLDGYANDVSLVNGEFVVHLRKPTFSEKLKQALMPPSMKRERVAVLHAVVRDAAEKVGLDGNQFLRFIATGNSAAALKSIHDAGIIVAVRNTERTDLFG